MKFETYIEKAHEVFPGSTFKVWLHTGNFFDIRPPEAVSALKEFKDSHWERVKDKPAFDDEHLVKHEANEKVLAAQPTTPVKDKDYDE